MSSNNVYGVLDANDCHVDICKTLLGAKRYATKNGYDKVSVRYNYGYDVSIVCEKKRSQWIDLYQQGEV